MIKDSFPAYYGAGVIDNIVKVSQILLRLYWRKWLFTHWSFHTLDASDGRWGEAVPYRRTSVPQQGHSFESIGISSLQFPQNVIGGRPMSGSGFGSRTTCSLRASQGRLDRRDEHSIWLNFVPANMKDLRTSTQRQIDSYW
jgi:hypothetical protein